MISLRILSILCLIGIPLFGAPQKGLDNQVRETIKALQESLRSEQQEDGSWLYLHGKSSDLVGPTALAVMALVRSGIPKEDPAVVRGMTFLLNNSSERVAYNESLVVCAFEMIDTERKHKKRVKKSLEALIKAQHQEKGFWGYTTITKGRSRVDNSTTQIALLGLSAGKKYGFSIPPKTLKLALQHWKSCQFEDGSWDYSNQNKPTIQMTCAGIASLHLIGEHEETILADCGQYKANPLIGNAFNWIDTFISEGGKVNKAYSLYALERVALYLDKKEIAGKDWYRLGVDVILKSYKKHNVPDKSFMLLFLAKGFTPIGIAKWKWGGDWNNHHYDLKNWLLNANEDLKRDLDWYPAKIDTLNSPAAKASLIYANGLGEFTMTEKEADFLRSFLDMRGTVLFENCRSSPTFISSVMNELSLKLFPGSTLSFQPIKEGHPLLSSHYSLHPSDI